MLVDLEAPPERSLYYIGAHMIRELLEAPNGRVELTWIYKRLNTNKSPGNSVPLEYCILAADWLFLLGAVRITAEGDIEKCF